MILSGKWVTMGQLTVCAIEDLLLRIFVQNKKIALFLSGVGARQANTTDSACCPSKLLSSYEPAAFENRQSMRNNCLP